MIMEKDFDNSFKNWFKIMWSNWYLPIFIVTFGVLIYEICIFDKVVTTITDNFDEGGTMGGIFTILGVSLPLIISSVIAYKGFFQFWKDLKNGISR